VTPLVSILSDLYARSKINDGGDGHLGLVLMDVHFHWVVKEPVCLHWFAKRFHDMAREHGLESASASSSSSSSAASSDDDGSDNACVQIESGGVRFTIWLWVTNSKHTRANAPLSSASPAGSSYGSDSKSALLNGNSEAKEQHEDDEDSGLHPGEEPLPVFNLGRPVASTVLRRAVRAHAARGRGKAPVAVFACGPQPMVDDLLCAALAAESAECRIDVHTETFRL
jgi:hypothetical protein